MVRVRGHWRATGWVRTHVRHPLRPGEGQLGLVLLAGSPIRLDPGRYHPDGVAPSCPLTGRVAVDPVRSVPLPRGPADPPSVREYAGPSRACAGAGAQRPSRTRTVPGSGEPLDE